MKNVMVLIVLIFIGNTLYAQDRNKQFSEGYEKQIGLNVTNFFLRFVSFNQGLQNTPGILLLYKKGTDGKKWRYGLGGGIRLNKNKNDNSNSNQDQISGNIDIAYNFGREYYKTISKRWLVHFGWETLYRGDFSKSNNISFNINGKVTQNNFSLNLGTGAQAIGGIQFRLNDRLSLLTETSYGVFFSYIRMKSTTEFEDQINNQNENRIERYSLYTFFYAPTSIILNYHF